MDTHEPIPDPGCRPSHPLEVVPRATVLARLPDVGEGPESEVQPPRERLQGRARLLSQAASAKILFAGMALVLILAVVPLFLGNREGERPTDAVRRQPPPPPRARMVPEWDPAEPAIVGTAPKPEADASETAVAVTPEKARGGAPERGGDSSAENSATEASLAWEGPRASAWVPPEQRGNWNESIAYPSTGEYFSRPPRRVAFEFGRGEDADAGPSRSTSPAGGVAGYREDVAEEGATYDDHDTGANQPMRVNSPAAAGGSSPWPSGDQERSRDRGEAGVARLQGHIEYPTLR